MGGHESGLHHARWAWAAFLHEKFVFRIMEKANVAAHDFFSMRETDFYIEKCRNYIVEKQRENVSLI